jgi:ABC-type Zn uptake system ZnuABC Zn-binding protein ZnuA
VQGILNSKEYCTGRMNMLTIQAKTNALRIWAVLLLLTFVGCGTETNNQANTPAGQARKLSVVATTTQIRSMAEAIAGDKATVRSILTPGADPHDYEPTPNDVQAVAQSVLVLKNGIGLDDWMDKLISNAGGERPVVVATEGIPLHKAAAVEEGVQEEGGEDPHVWFSATNAMTMTHNIRDALMKVDPTNAAAYNTNAAAYLVQLGELDKYIVGQVNSVPQDDRKMVTNHDAFGYFIDRYGLKFVGSIIPSMSTGAQPSPQDVANLLKKLKEERVKAIFLESSINPALAQQIGNDAGVKVVDTLYGDTLGESGTPGADYIGMMRYNADTIVAALK